MRFRAQAIVVCYALVATTQALGAQTIDCQIDKINVGSDVRMSPDANLLMTVQGKIRNNEQVTYEKDEPIVVADVQIVRTTPVVIPGTDMTLKQDRFIGMKWKMPGKRPLPALQEIALPDGRVFLIVPVWQDHAFLATKNGELCSAGIGFGPTNASWVRDLRSEPEDAAVEFKIREEVTDRAGVRIIFNGASGGQINFQEVWVAGSSIRSSVTRSFDLFAKSVYVGLFDFEVIDVSAGKITLRYQIQDRGTVKAADVTKAGLKPGTPAGVMLVRTGRQ